MTLAGFVERYGRAIILSVALISGAGLVAGAGLPSSIYPRLEFPRVVIIGHSGTLSAQTMMLSVTRPLEQAVMEVPGSVGCARRRSGQRPRSRRSSTRRPT